VFFYIIGERNCWWRYTWREREREKRKDRLHVVGEITVKKKPIFSREGITIGGENDYYFVNQNPIFK